MSNSFSIGFIGAGNMASALVGGMIANGISADSIMLSDINQEQLQQLKKQFGIRIAKNNQELIQTCKTVVLAVKPQVMRDVISELASDLRKHKPLLISIAAGITISSLTKWIADDLPIIRCMPNTPALVKLGASALYPNELVNESQKQAAQNILGAVGIIEWLENEAQIDAVTALSGSGPAYYFLMMEAMIEAGKNLGLSETSARTLTMQTALGAASMAQKSDVGIAELRRRVTSPKGTTEAALNSFNENKFSTIVATAMTAAQKRSIELSKD